MPNHAIWIGVRLTVPLALIGAIIFADLCAGGEFALTVPVFLLCAAFCFSVDGVASRQMPSLAPTKSVQIVLLLFLITTAVFVAAVLAQANERLGWRL